MRPARIFSYPAVRQFFQARATQTRPQPVSRLLHQPCFGRRLLSQRAVRPVHASRGDPYRLHWAFRSIKQSARRFATSTEVAPQKLSISQRLKQLSREYGWTALGVYFALSALDLPLCFLAVRWIGTDTVGHWEHVVVTQIKQLIRWPLGQTAQAQVDGAIAEVAPTRKIQVPVSEAREGEQRQLEENTTYVVTDHGYKEAEAANRGDNASLGTQLAFAYAIHKTFIFVRVPLTAAILPKVVKTLRSWGYNIGKRPVKAVPASNTGVNTRGSGVKSD